jgi:hypothetical protein
MISGGRELSDAIMFNYLKGALREKNTVPVEKGE